VNRVRGHRHELDLRDLFCDFLLAPIPERMSATGSTVPGLIRPGLAFWSLERILNLHYCVNGCELDPHPDGTVRSVLPYKKHSRLRRNERPVMVEAGWLLDGHHRVAYALTRGKDGMWVQVVRGKLTTFQDKYRAIETAIQTQNRIS